jgi:ketosteroid isomerase-like protein
VSQANVDVVRRIYEAVARRDVVTPFELYAEDIVWDMSRARRALLLTTTVARGHEGVRNVWREALAVFDQVDYDVAEFVDADDRVMAIVREREVGRVSGVPVEAGHYVVWTLRDGKVSRMQLFDDREEAFAEAGLGRPAGDCPGPSSLP